MKKIYISGCGGMLGEAFYREFKDDYILKCTDRDVNDPWLSFLDFRYSDAYRKDVTEFNPDYLFHLGAYTDMEFCENNEQEVYRTNILPVEDAVHIANNLNIPILYISTSGIFNGDKEAYDDWDIPNPSNVYARSKYMGERFVVENAKRYLAARAGWMMGGGKKDKKFVSKILRQIESEEIKAVSDKFGTPTYTYDFAKTIKELITLEYWGTYNCACEGNASRAEIAKEIVRIMGSKTKVTEVESDYFEGDYFVPRSMSECLLNSKLHLRGINIMRDWKISLEEYLNNQFKK